MVATSGSIPIAVRVDRPDEVGADRLVNVLAALWAEPTLADRIENLTEWWGAALLMAGFIALARLWRRAGVHATISP